MDVPYIKWDADSDSSMSALLTDWSKSDHDISDRLILAVKNKDVAALNHGARQYLKLEGKLTGNEIAVFKICHCNVTLRKSLASHH